MNQVTASDRPAPSPVSRAGDRALDVRIGLLTGGGDRPYALGLAATLAARGVRLDFIGSDQLESPELRARAEVNFLNLRGDQGDAGLLTKVVRVATYYARLIGYAWRARPPVFHILWNNKFEHVDRTLLLLYYRMLGKRIVLTAHNVNAARRDSRDSAFNRLTLRVQYGLADHIFVHTEAMKRELIADFGVRADRVTIVHIGTNDAVPVSGLTTAEARRRLGLAVDDRAILFFGHIAPYKGLEFLVEAFRVLSAADRRYRLVIAGKPKQGAEKYLEDIQRTIAIDGIADRVIQKIEFVPEEDTEVY